MKHSYVKQAFIVLACTILVTLVIADIDYISATLAFGLGTLYIIAGAGTLFIASEVSKGSAKVLKDMAVTKLSLTISLVMQVVFIYLFYINGWEVLAELYAISALMVNGLYLWLVQTGKLRLPYV